MLASLNGLNRENGDKNNLNTGDLTEDKISPREE